MGKFDKPANLLVLDLINAVNVKPGTSEPLALTPGEVVFGKPVAIENEPDWNTKLLCTATLDSPYIGSVNLLYARLDIVALFKNIKVNLDVQEATTTTDLLDRLNARYGLGVTSADIVPSPVAPLSSDTPSVNAEITFADSCLVYFGTLAVTVGPDVEVGERLSTVVLQTELDGLHYPDPDTDKGQAYIYSYGVDFTDIKPYLQTLKTEGAVVWSDLAREFNKVAEDLWVTDTDPAEYNLQGSVVKYAGVTSDPAAGDVNDAYSHVVVLTVSDSLCTNFAGDLYLHYNA